MRWKGIRGPAVVFVIIFRDAIKKEGDGIEDEIHDLIPGAEVTLLHPSWLFNPASIRA